MRDTAIACQIALDLMPTKKWAETFVELRMAFFRRFGRGLFASTAHGADYFRNVVEVCEGRLVWEEKGECGNNFREMIAKRPRGATQ